MPQKRFTPDDSHAVQNHDRYRDHRKTSVQILTSLKGFAPTALITFGLTISPFVLPHTVWISISIIPVIAFRCGYAYENTTLPLKLPEELGKIKDKHDNLPGQRWAYEYAQGTVLLGNQQLTDKELWLTGADLLTHALVIGTTGAGKTVALVGIAAATAFCRGGGLIYIDAKAGPELLYEISALCRIFGREDDLRVINYSLTGGSTKSRSYKVLSNTTSPFAHGTDSQAVATLTDTMSSGGNENKFFADRAVAILKILMPVLCELRDMGVLTIRPSTITDYMSISRFMELAQNKIVIDGEERPGIAIRETTRKPIETFLKQMAVDFDKSPSDQDPKVNEQFSYAEGYFALPMANFAGTYAHIYEAELAEADFVDVVLNNRILLVMIPAMQLSASEIGSLGKIVLAALKVALSQGLGGDNAGDYDDTIGSLPVDQRVPTVTIIDEYPAIVVEGFATAATQGRAVGMVCIFSGQDFPGFTGASSTEADQIFGSTRLKLLLATEDAGITLTKFQELAGKQAVAEGHGWEKGQGYVDTFKNNVGASIHEVDRIDIKEINEQDKGEAHVFHRGKVIRSNLFFTNIKKAQVRDNFRYNKMLPISPPDQETLGRLVTIRRQARYLEQVAKYDPSSFDCPLAEDIGYWAEKGGNDWPTKILLRFNKTKEVVVPSSQVAPIDEVQTTVDMLNQVDQMEDENPIDLKSLAGPVTNNPNDDLEEAIFASSGDSAPFDSSEQTTSTDNFSHLLSEAKNSWVFTVLSQVSGNKNRCGDIVDKMTELNTALGMGSTRSNERAITQMNSFATEINYPAHPVEAKPDDADELYRAIENLCTQS